MYPTFKSWLDKIDEYLKTNIGMELRHFEDHPYEQYYEMDTSPEDFILNVMIRDEVIKGAVNLGLFDDLKEVEEKEQ